MTHYARTNTAVIKVLKTNNALLRYSCKLDGYVTISNVNRSIYYFLSHVYRHAVQRALYPRVIAARKFQQENRFPCDVSQPDIIYIHAKFRGNCYFPLKANFCVEIYVNSFSYRYTRDTYNN